MTKTEWKYLTENCFKFSYERILVDTKFGCMVVFCNMVATTLLMVGVIFHGDRKAMLSQYRHHATSLEFFSPRAELLLKKSGMTDDVDYGRAEETAKLAFSAFRTAGMRQDLMRSLSGATDYLIRRICAIARFIGCHVDCRSIRESVPYVRQFNSDAFISIMICLMMFVYEKCPSRHMSVAIGDMDGKPIPVIRCEVPDGEREVFVNRQYRYMALCLCDELAERRRFAFECMVKTDGEGDYLHIMFSPDIEPLEKLGMKTPLTKLDYSDLESGAVEDVFKRIPSQHKGQDSK